MSSEAPQKPSIWNGRRVIMMLLMWMGMGWYVAFVIRDFLGLGESARAVVQTVWIWGGVVLPLVVTVAWFVRQRLGGDQER